MKWVTISRHVKEKEVNRSSEHGYTMGNIYLTDLISFCNKKASLTDKGRAVVFVFRDFDRVFDTAP